MTDLEADLEASRVLTAIKNGNAFIKAIMKQTGFTSPQVRRCIKRLTRSGDIRRKLAGGYELARKPVALSEVWR